MVPESEHILGVKVIDGDVENHVAICEWTIESHHLNRYGIALGGFTAAVADVAIGYASALTVDEGIGFTSVNLITTYHRPLNVGKAYFKAKIKRKGKSVLYAEVEIEQNGKLAGDVVSTLMTFPLNK